MGKRPAANGYVVACRLLNIMIGGYYKGLSVLFTRKTYVNCSIFLRMEPTLRRLRTSSVGRIERRTANLVQTTGRGLSTNRRAPTATFGLHPDQRTVSRGRFGERRNGRRGQRSSSHWCHENDKKIKCIYIVLFVS